MSDSTNEGINRAISMLRQLREDEIRPIVARFFAQRNYTMDDTCHKEAMGKKESEHGCDLIMWQSNLLVGVQLKRNKDFNSGARTDEFKAAATKALDFEYQIGDEVRKLVGFYWITTGNVDRRYLNSFLEREKGNRSFRGQVWIWDAERLYREFMKDRFEAIPFIELCLLKNDMSKCLAKGQYVFAAHYAFECFLWHLKNKEIEEAKKAIESACAYVGMDERKSTYFYRTLGLFYHLWQFVAEEAKSAHLGYRKSPLEIAIGGEVENLLRRSAHSDVASLLVDVQFIMEQLRILEKSYVNSPAGLSTLQMCRLLLRAGFPPTGRIGDRLKRIQEDMRKEHGESLDGKCSICTGTAVSCLSLARETDNEETDNAEKAIKWLRGLHRHRYCYRRALRLDRKPQEHAMHYAASVLQAFWDYGDDGAAQSVFDMFFKSKRRDADDLWSEWMKYRKASADHICSYVFSAFLNGLLAGKYEFGRPADEYLLDATANLVSRFKKDCPRTIKPWEMYGVRENMAGLCLATVAHRSTPGGPLTETAADWLRALIGRFHKKICPDKIYADDFEVAKTAPMDSNVDRTRSMLEGWLQCWETRLFLRDAGKSGGYSPTVMSNKRRRNARR